MIKITSLQAVAAALLACGLSAAPAQAGRNRTFVSGLGTDSGACTRAAPCRTFAFAIAQTNSGGEIDVLDPAGYGPVTINKAISIVNDGVGTAGIVPTTSSRGGITIEAGATDSIHLRGLTIEGFGNGFSGILFRSGGNLAIENCVIRDFLEGGIVIEPSTPSSFSVSNTIASNNGSAGIDIFSPGSATVTGVLSKVTANNNNNSVSNGMGILVGLLTGGGPLNVTIVDSVASNNAAVGIKAASAAAAVMVRDSVASNNGSGLSVEASAILRVAHSVVTGNATGVNTSGGTIQSYGDNDIDGNLNNNTGVLTKIPTH